MIVNKFETYKQKDFKNYYNGICLFSSIYFCYHDLFNDDIEFFQKEFIDKLHSKGHITIINELNKYLRTKNIELIIHELKTYTDIEDKLEQLFNAEKTVPMGIFYFSNEPAHAVQMVGMDRDNLYYVENGMSSEFFNDIIPQEYLHLIRFLINHDYTKLEKYHISQEILEKSLNPEFFIDLVNDKYKRELYECIMTWAISFYNDKIIRIKKDLIYGNAQKLIIIYPDIYKNSFIGFSNRLKKLQEKDIPFTGHRTIEEGERYTKKELDELKKLCLIKAKELELQK